MFSQRIYGCEKPKVKRGVAPPICNLEISGMPLITKTL